MLKCEVELRSLLTLITVNHPEAVSADLMDVDLNQKASAAIGKL